MRTKNSDSVAFGMFGLLGCLFSILNVVLGIAFIAGAVWAVIWVLQHTGVI